LPATVAPALATFELAWRAWDWTLHQPDIIAALLLPLYYLADANITFVRRLVSGEPVMQAHRRHCRPITLFDAENLLR
jgi:hypothetical protein